MKIANLILGTILIGAQATLAGECSIDEAKATKILQSKASVIGAIKETKQQLKIKSCSSMKTKVSEGDKVQAVVACNLNGKNGLEGSIYITITAEGWCSGDLFIQNIRFDYAG